MYHRSQERNATIRRRVFGFGFPEQKQQAVAEELTIRDVLSAIYRTKFGIFCFYCLEEHTKTERTEIYEKVKNLLSTNGHLKFCILFNHPIETGEVYVVRRDLNGSVTFFKRDFGETH